MNFVMMMIFGCVKLEWGIEFYFVFVCLEVFIKLFKEKGDLRFLLCEIFGLNEFKFLEYNIVNDMV